MKLSLGIETSCDDTSIAIVREDGWVLAQRSADQNKAHESFGGVVPEIACRNHSYQILPLIDQVLKDAKLELSQIDCIAVTSEPGLIGSLLVGLVTAKSLALILNKDFIGVNHLEGHLMAGFLSDETYKPAADLNEPFIALAISGGHTSLYKINEFGSYDVLGATKDDAAGEAFDKFAKMLDLGYPGGVLVDKFAQTGDIKAFQFPRPMIHEDHYMFSFSGLKASALRCLQNMSEEDRQQQKENLCASYQEAIVDVLIHKLFRAADEFKISNIVVTGGVSANSRLRARAQEEASKRGMKLVIPPLRYCTDNAAMIAYTGLLRFLRGEKSQQNLAPKARAPLGQVLDLKFQKPSISESPK